MKLNSEPVRNWFGFTRRERRSTSILLTIIIVIIVLRCVLPEQNIKIETYGTILADTEIIYKTYEPEIFSGKFRKTADIRKVYGVDSNMAANLDPHVKFSSGTSGRAVSGSPVQKKPLLDINSCDSLSLVALPGIGPVLSARIIKYRNLLGGFARVEQLKEVYGLPAETYEMIKGRLFADSSCIRKIDVNSSGYKELSRIPYIEKYEVTAILKYRELTGRIKSIEDLKENKILTFEKAEKVEPYLDFR